MRALRDLTLLLLFALVHSMAAAGDTPLSLSQYIEQLAQLQRAVASAADSNAVLSLAQQLPAQWLVDGGVQVFTVPADDTQQLLRDYAKQRTPANLAMIHSQLDLLLSNARAMQAAKSNTGAERDKLQQILSRHEFRNVKNNSWYDRWKRAAQHWLAEMFRRMVGSSSFPVVSRIIVWVLLAAAVFVAAFWIIRIYRRENIYTALAGSPQIPLIRPWRDWQAQAQSAAEQGRWRDAVHFSYWAGITFLEAQGLWRPDPSRTPREYLRLLPPGNQHRDPLRQLTRSFELVWYGTDAATAETFAGASSLLERLGCR